MALSYAKKIPLMKFYSKIYEIFEEEILHCKEGIPEVFLTEKVESTQEYEKW